MSTEGEEESASSTDGDGDSDSEDDGSSRSSGDSGDDGRSDEEDEPILKYQRLGGAVKVILAGSDRASAAGKPSPHPSLRRLQADDASCLIVHRSFLALGTYDGAVYVLDFYGNLVQRLAPHTAKVNDISVDDAGEYIASCSDDGRVVITCVKKHRGAPAKGGIAAKGPGIAGGGGGHTAGTAGGVGGAAPGGTKVVGPSSSSPSSSYTYYTPVYTVRLDPNYGRKSQKVFASGGASEKLLLNKKSRWAWNSQEVEIHRGEGPISSIAWQRGRSSGQWSLVAWANSLGIKIYDVDADKRISFIERPSKLATDAGAAACKCHLCWQDGATLLIGWADTVNIVKIRKKPGNVAAARGGGGSGGSSGIATDSGPQIVAEIDRIFRIDATICGISPFGSKALALLCFVVADDDDGDRRASLERESRKDDVGGQAGGATASYPPELRIISREDGEDQSSDALPIKGHQYFTASDYCLSAEHRHVTGAEGLPVLFVVSPKDIVVARPRDVNDHIAWALDKRDYESALIYAQEAEAMAMTRQRRQMQPGGHGTAYDVFAASDVKEDQLRDLADRYLEHLFSAAEFPAAAALCPRLLRGNANQWEKWVGRFEKCRQLHIVAEFLPTSDPRLSSRVYEITLQGFLEKHDYDAFLRTIRLWPDGGTSDGGGPAADSSHNKPVKTLYNVDSVIKSVLDTMRHEHRSMSLKSALAELYIMCGKYTLALREYLDGPSGCVAGEMGGGESSEGGGGRQIVFDLIEQHNLLRSVQDKWPANWVLNLLDIDEERAITMLVESSKFVPPQVVARQVLSVSGSSRKQQLQGDPGGGLLHSSPSVLSRTLGSVPDHRRRLLYRYLHRLFCEQPGVFDDDRFTDVHEVLVPLYAEFARPGSDELLTFLRQSDFYNLTEALRICNEHKPEPLFRAVVFILERMGGDSNNRRAVSIIVNKLRDVPWAISFVEKANDDKLWSDLIDAVIQEDKAQQGLEHGRRDGESDTTRRSEGSLLGDLLDHVGSHAVDPVRLINRIPDDMRIYGLRDKLLAILSDAAAQLRLREGCKAVLKDDKTNLLRRQVSVRNRGVRVRVRRSSVATAIAAAPLPDGARPARESGPIKGAPALAWGQDVRPRDVRRSFTGALASKMSVFSRK